MAPESSTEALIETFLIYYGAMAIRIDVVPTIPDARAALKRKAFRDLVRGKLTQVHIADSYIVDTTLTKTELDRARSALTNPLVESSTVGRWIPKRFDVAIEVASCQGLLTTWERLQSKRLKTVLVGNLRKESTSIHRKYFS